MKTNSIISTLAACSLLTLTNGCSKQESTEPAPAAPAASAPEAVKAPPPPPALPAADLQKDAADAAAQKQAQADKLAADKAAAEKAAADAQAQLTSGTAKVQALIDSAKKLASENKWEEVLKILSSLTGQNLTESQQSAVNALQADAQKHAEAAAADKAASAIGGALAPKK